MLIYKYELQATDRQLIKTGHRKAKPLRVAEQHGKLMLWAEVVEGCHGIDEYAICVDIAGTGNPFTSGGTYLDTVVMSSGLVWHIYTETLQRGE